jgi:formylglycine-generating enzyme required for sulfatase activity
LVYDCNHCGRGHSFGAVWERRIAEIIVMTRLRSRFLLLVLFCLTLAAPAHAEKRVALVIGNGFYQYQPILTNPKHDAEDVAKALSDLNFDVVIGLDLTRAGMNEKLDEFSRKADGADIAFVYYSGHGMQFGGFNYLLPTDASLDSGADVNPFRLVRIDSVMETLGAVNGPKIVVLDACRDNPVANELKRKLATLRGTKGAEVTHGLSPISGSSVSGLLVAYATQADETALDGKGRNSPFTAAFIKNVGDPDTDIRQMFFHVQDEVVRETDGKQRPEISVSLVGEYKLKITITPVKPSETVPPAVTPAAPVAGGPGEAERAWGYVKDTTSPKVLEDFIHRFPGTIFAELAREKLEELKAKAQAAVAAPAVPPPPPIVMPAPVSPPPKIAEPQVAVAAPPVVPAVPSSPCGGGTVGVSLSSRSSCPLSIAEERSLKSKDSFKECDKCPEMVVVPAGSFRMGAPANDKGYNEEPQHSVTISKPFAVGRFAVTFGEWDACVADGGCYSADDHNWGRGRRPVINVDWNGAKSYVAWLSRKTGKVYRLLSEVEREYVTRAGTTTPFWWGASISTSQANYDGNYTYSNDGKQANWGSLRNIGRTGERRNMTVPVDSFEPNPWGLYQVHGNVWEWVEDCWHKTYNGAPADGSAWVFEKPGDGSHWSFGKCDTHVKRGGSYGQEPWWARSAGRDGGTLDIAFYDTSFRVARTLVAP